MPPSPPRGGAPSNEEKTWATFAHLSALLGYIGVPLGNVIGPLVIWLLKKDQMPFLDDQGKEAVNFQITLLLAGLLSAVLTVILIGFLLLFVIWIGGIVLTIIATMKANEGVAYRYPFALRLIK